MKNWEDIFKESLEDCSSSLPEGSLEEFQRKLSSSRKPAAGRLAWLALPAAAACAAVAVLIPHHDSGTAVEETHVVAEAAAPVNVVTVEDAPDEFESGASDPVQATVRPGQEAAGLRSGKLIAQSFMPADDDLPVADGTDTREAGVEAEVTVNAGMEDNHVMPEPENDVRQPSVPESVTWVDLDKMSARRHRKGGNAAAVLGTGGGVLGGAAAGLLASVTKMDCELPGNMVMSDGLSSRGEGVFATPVNSVIRTRHMMPVKAGVTVRYPLSERFYLMSGLEYSLYRSESERFLTGKEQQYAHYLGIPVRVDWSALKTKHLDLYLGAGLSADRCVHAVSDGSKIWGDKMNFSLLAAGGALVKLNRWAGLYLEPQFSWRALSSGGIETYRSEHPAMLGVSAGVRFTIGE